MKASSIFHSAAAAAVAFPAAAFAVTTANVQFEATGTRNATTATNWSAAGTWTVVGGSSALTYPNDPGFVTGIRVRVSDLEKVVTDGNYSVQRVYFNTNSNANTLASGQTAVKVAAGNTLTTTTYTGDGNTSVKFGGVGNGATSSAYSNLMEVAGTLSGTGLLNWQADGTFQVDSGGSATLGGMSFNSAAYSPVLSIARGGTLSLVANTVGGVSTSNGGVTGSVAALATDFSGDAGGFGSISAASYAEFGTLNLTTGATPSTGTYTLISTGTNLTGLSGAFSAVTLNGSALLLNTATVSNGATYTLVQTGNALTLAVVSTPEPTVLGLSLLVPLAGGRGLRRRVRA